MAVPTICPDQTSGSGWFLAVAALREPRCWASSTVAPMDRPVMRTVAVKRIWLPVATAETSSVAANWPTTQTSTAP